MPGLSRWRPAVPLVGAVLVGALLVIAACTDSAIDDRAEGDGSAVERSEPSPAGEPAAGATPAASTDDDPAGRALLDVDGLPRLTAGDPDFDTSEPCRLVDVYYRHLGLELKEARPRAELESLLDQRVALLQAIEVTPIGADVPEVAISIALEQVFARRLLAQWGASGHELLDELDRTGRRLLDHVMADPVVVGGRVLSEDDREAAAQLDWVDDQLILACTTAPDGWGPLSDDTALELPDLTFVAGASNADWSTFDLGGAGPGPIVASALLSLELGPVGSVMIASAWPDRSLRLIDPVTWSSTPIAEAGFGWSCPSWSVDGSSILGDLVDPVTGERTPVEFRPDDGRPPTPLPDAVGSCPKSIGADEVVTVADDAVLGVSLDGVERELMAVEHCNLVPITRPRNGELDIYANCRNPYLDGLHLVDVATGRARLAIPGRVGAGDISADGRWRLFAYGTHDQRATDVVLWILDQETGRARSLDHAQFFPIFLPS